MKNKTFIMKSTKNKTLILNTYTIYNIKNHFSYQRTKYCNLFSSILTFKQLQNKTLPFSVIMFKTEKLWVIFLKKTFKVNYQQY